MPIESFPKVKCELSSTIIPKCKSISNSNSYDADSRNHSKGLKICMISRICAQCYKLNVPTANLFKIIGNFCFFEKNKAQL